MNLEVQLEGIANVINSSSFLVRTCHRLLKIVNIIIKK